MTAETKPPATLDLGSRLELLMDDFLVASLTGQARRVLHHPQPQEIVMEYNQPWEGCACAYQTVIRDGDRYQMWYKAWQIPADGAQGEPVYICYAESRDGIHWIKPNLGLFEHRGSKDNNIVFTGIGGRAHDLSPFIDENPDCKADARYKAVGFGRKPEGLFALQSPDGLRWSLMSDQPIMTGMPFDTQNIAYWDAGIGKYRAYVRDFRMVDNPDGSQTRLRDIRTATSDDMIHWTKPTFITYTDPVEQALYTNQIRPYYRAPHIAVGFPARYVDRGWVPGMQLLPELELRQERSKTHPRYGSAVTDALVMFSRDGQQFQRWDEAFLRPGLRTRHNWSYGDNYIGWHLVETASTRDDSPEELSLYATESYFTGNTCRLRRFTLRIDGFISITAPLAGGEMITKPIRFDGPDLQFNFSTSAAGSLHAELQRPDGTPIEGFTLGDCDEIFGDAICRTIRWRNDRRAGELAGQTVRLRVVLRDADLFSICFGQTQI